MEGLVDGSKFRSSIDDILDYLCVPNEGDVTYTKSVTLDVLIWIYVFAAKLDGISLKSSMRLQYTYVVISKK